MWSKSTLAVSAAWLLFLASSVEANCGHYYATDEPMPLKDIILGSNFIVKGIVRRVGIHHGFNIEVDVSKYYKGCGPENITIGGFLRRDDIGFGENGDNCSHKHRPNVGEERIFYLKRDIKFPFLSLLIFAFDIDWQHADSMNVGTIEDHERQHREILQTIESYKTPEQCSDAFEYFNNYKTSGFIPIPRRCPQGYSFYGKFGRHMTGDVKIVETTQECAYRCNLSEDCGSYMAGRMNGGPIHCAMYETHGQRRTCPDFSLDMENDGNCCIKA